ncbi:DUF317 domain-containing protein [Streptomyces anulatus]|uniref:DUF317 domain-containing protein n=1 Tax=Streptomyces anulatus TaxID=1892 RepID=UPI0036C01530
MEAPLYPDRPHDPSAYWVGPRHLAGDDGRLYDTVADALAGLGWSSLTIVRGQRMPEEAAQDRKVLRSTVLHISPDTLRWAQWSLPDEPLELGERPVAWQVSARADTSSPIASWSAHFTLDVPGEVIADFLFALDAREQPALPLGGPELVLDAVTAHGWFRDSDQPDASAMDATLTSQIRLGEVSPLIQDGDPRALTLQADDMGPRGWQAFSEPVMGRPLLWVVSFSAGVPHDLVASFAQALTSSAPVLRRVLPESTRDRLLRAPAC